MKTILMSCLMMFVAFSTYANSPKTDDPDDYVKTKNDVIYYSKLTLGPTKAKLILDNGDKMTLMNNELVAFKKNGKVYEKVALYHKNKNTNKDVFMEVVKYTNGMKLYRYMTYEQEVNLPYSASATKAVEKYYVFKNRNYHLQIDAENYKTVFAFFGINATLEN